MIAIVMMVWSIPYFIHLYCLPLTPLWSFPPSGLDIHTPKEMKPGWKPEWMVAMTAKSWTPSEVVSFPVHTQPPKQSQTSSGESDCVHNLLFLESVFFDISLPSFPSLYIQCKDMADANLQEKHLFEHNIINTWLSMTLLYIIILYDSRFSSTCLSPFKQHKFLYIA